MSGSSTGWPRTSLITATPGSGVHALRTLLAQRIIGIALGYEDLNDHDDLPGDPLLALLADTLEGRRKGCTPLADKSTLQRLEHALAAGAPGRYHRIDHDPDALQAVLIGVAKNARLIEKIGWELADAHAGADHHNRPARRFAECLYATPTSWSRWRRVVAKAEHLPGKANPRFVVTSLPAGTFSARTVYERVYCPRGKMENTIKEQQLDLFSDRTSASRFDANQLRLLFSAFASILFDVLRRTLVGTRLARATAGTVRLKLLKIGARVTVSVRRVKIAMDSAHPPPTPSHGSTPDYQRSLPPPVGLLLTPPRGTGAPYRHPGPLSSPESPVHMTLSGTSAGTLFPRSRCATHNSAQLPLTTRHSATV